MYYNEFEGMEMCFLLDVDYLGKIYRFSTIPIDLEDTRENLTVRYDGGLEDPDINQETSFLGVSIEGDAVSMQLVFAELDWVEEWLAGRVLDHSKAILYAVPIRGGTTSFTLLDRVPLYSGKVSSPIYGDPEKPKGWIAFSVENNENIQVVKLLEGSNEITRNRFPSPVQDAVYGKYAPFVFGKPGLIPKPEANRQVSFTEKYATTPALQVQFTRQSSPSFEENVRYLIAHHPVKASIGRIYDPAGGSFRNPILVDSDGEGNLYSYVNFKIISTGADVLEYDNFQQSSGGVEIFQDFYASWGEEDGGYFQAFSSGTMTGGGDICMYFLEKIGLDYDYQAWAGLLGVLNRYKFSGYINDYETKAFSWLKENIISNLPIEVVNSTRGITPKLNLYFYSDIPQVLHHVRSSGDFQIITGIQPLDQPIINHLTVKFCYASSNDAYQATIIIDPRLDNEETMVVNDPIARLSFERFGLREQVMELPFVWDLATAFRIARNTIRVRGLGAKALEVSASPRYSYIEIGDIISLTSDIGLTDHKCQIISKSWRDNRWFFVLHIEENPIINQRQ